MSRTLILVLFLVISISSANASLFGPDNYEDCILEAIPTAKTDLAVTLVMDSCRAKFPSKSTKKTTKKPEEPSGNPLGEYVCERLNGKYSVWNIYVDEEMRLFKVNEMTLTIERSTGKALYTESFQHHQIDDATWVFKRLGNNRYVTNDTVYAELVGTAREKKGNVKKGQTVRLNSKCEKSVL